MKAAILAIQWAVRLLALALVSLGVLFWSGRAFDLVPVHMRLGEVLIALLWILSGMSLRAGARLPLVVAATLYGLVVFLFAMNMGRFLPGGAHEVIRILHLLLGLGVVGFAESLGARVRRAVG